MISWGLGVLVSHIRILVGMNHLKSVVPHAHFIATRRRLIEHKGTNPAEWFSRGYAVVDIDSRGSGHFEGDLMFWGEQVPLKLIRQ